MGLDMYALTTDEKPQPPVDFSGPDDASQLHYWRKHPNLHGWMERLYREKGGKEDTFNCVSVALSADDIHQLEIDIEAGNLPPTSGFFFGASDGTESDDDLAFVAKLVRRSRKARRCSTRRGGSAPAQESPLRNERAFCLPLSLAA
ncbi:hypothetical protein [Sphingopyxis sp. BSNA05]|uniref:hypothetical protein n=1 Tax=Sphingopyxis sp. BSNA05 TaxID=1236614 RepID=UPI001C269728|nr:hypothetical protein [Sphingopyxis sp. BSNA05]